MHNNNTGFAIAIAWPETYCKQPGSWYDGLMHLFGFSQHRYYKVGHAALVLINTQAPTESHYFDFGRYHAPFGYGRVRGKNTDPELAMHTQPIISADHLRIENFQALLTELQNNPACHGEGAIHASYCSVNYQAAFNKVTQLQTQSPIVYGPFNYGGNNCSRFVSDGIVAGQPMRNHLWKLLFKVPFTPTPLSNVHALEHVTVLPKLTPLPLFVPKAKSNNDWLKNTLSPPKRSTNIPLDAQWLSGEGAGSWFHLQARNSTYTIRRYNPDGQLEFEAPFTLEGAIPFHANDGYQFTYLSHYQHIKIKQGQHIYHFHLQKHSLP